MSEARPEIEDSAWPRPSEIAERPLITAIIPTFRRPKLLRRAITSVLRQTYSHFQVCVYDNASGDETASVVQELAAADPRVLYHCHEQNIGGMANYRYGFEHVETPFFCTLGDDDALLPNFFEMALEGFERHPEAACSVCSVLFLDNRGRVTGAATRWPAGIYRPPQAALTLLANGGSWQAMLFRQEVLEVTGPLDVEKAGPAADLDFVMRLSLLQALVARPDPGALVRMDEGSWTHAFRFDDVIPRVNTTVQKIEADERIPGTDRSRVAGELHSHLGRRAVLFGKKSAIAGDWENVARYAACLEEEFHLPLQAFLLRATRVMCRSFPPLVLGLRLARRARRAYLRLRWLPTSRRYGSSIQVAGD